MSYRNAIYDQRNGCVKLFTWDENGRRIMVDASFSPYLYVEDPKGEKKTIYGTKAKKRIFTSGYERYKFIKDSGIKRLYENYTPVQQYLIDTFWRENETPEFSKFDIKTLFVDIETFSEHSFPDVENPTHPVNVITCYDTLSKRYTTFGTGAYDNKDSDVDYIHCRSEKQLFLKFIEYLEDDYPDIISGWNSEAFDIPYIVARCERLFDEDEVNRMSPVNKVYFKMKKGLFGNEQKRYFLDGISCIDYLDVYKRFCMTMRQSYKLDSIGEIELGKKKIDYGDMSLAELSKQDWQKFVEYNIQDVRLIVDLDEKLEYIKLIRMLSYIGCTTFEGAMGTLSTVTGALAIKARARGELMSTFNRKDNGKKNPGAYVSEPKRGFKSNVVSFDANSLYPNVMISLNLSPETKIGKVTREGDKINIYHISGKEFNLDKKQFKSFIDREQCTLTAAGFLFTQKFKGIVPEFLDYYYNERVKVKDELFKIKTELNKLKDDTSNKNSTQISNLQYEVNRLNTKQLTIKILINSLYGAFGNKYCSFGDDDIAGSVTLTGQGVIKEAGSILQRHLKLEYGIEDEKTLSDSWVYSDTDSCYFSLGCIRDEVPLQNPDGSISDKFYEAADKLENFLNVEITKWAERVSLTQDSRYMFKREVIADSAMFLQKKRYVMHILDDEGIKTSKFKYTGVEVNRSTMPTAIKPYAKDIIETMLSTKSLSETNKKLTEAYNIFINLPAEDIASVSGIGNYEKGASKCDGFNIGKGVVQHVKAAYLHNIINEKLGLSDKYETIGSGDKVRYMYVEPNKFNVDVIGFKYDMPDEYKEIFKIDYDKMFDKILFKSIQRFYDCAKWQTRKPSESVVTELFDLFS